MTLSPPWKTGLALALTMAFSYIVCALLYRQWPAQGIDFLNALFHGLDFHKLASPAPFTLAVFLYPLVVLALWGFVVGTVFAWLHTLLHGRR
ncbi:DUF5676 family membrane protein [Pseudogulbenkiania subflava]|uniref:Uncharacterized protein n=1 Tax=Pseudogulbenkiania subflava DSM 22618 TaxID=1123014 RepID=A0A1Y6B685_9NEIS|nr:DUF5676 family membrane protein [Pseudogulbenkiania subflava]SME92331.1 hypothetical protein SAMN02745746_00067 [Pseudogulbenkiania subflava DSM 22618]